MRSTLPSPPTSSIEFGPVVASEHFELEAVPPESSRREVAVGEAQRPTWTCRSEICRIRDSVAKPYAVWLNDDNALVGRSEY